MHGGSEVEQFAHLQTRLSITVEFERGPHDAGGLALGAQAAGRLFAMEFVESGLGVEGVDLTGAAVHEQVNEPFCPGPEVGEMGGQCGIGLLLGHGKTRQANSRRQTGQERSTGQGDLGAGHRTWLRGKWRTKGSKAMPKAGNATIVTNLGRFFLKKAEGW